MGGVAGPGACIHMITCVCVYIYIYLYIRYTYIVRHLVLWFKGADSCPEWKRSPRSAGNGKVGQPAATGKAHENR